PEPPKIERLMPEHPRQDPDDQRADGVKKPHVRVGPEPGRVEEKALVDGHAKGSNQDQPAGVLAQESPQGASVREKGNQTQRGKTESQQWQDTDWKFSDGDHGERRGGRTEE